MRGPQALVALVAFAAACGGRVDDAGLPLLEPAYEFGPLAVSDTRAFFVAKARVGSTVFLRSFDRASASVEDVIGLETTPEYVVQHDHVLYALDGARGPLRRIVPGEATEQILASGPAQKAVAFNAATVLVAGIEDGSKAIRSGASSRRPSLVAQVVSRRRKTPSCS